MTISPARLASELALKSASRFPTVAVCRNNRLSSACWIVLAEGVALQRGRKGCRRAEEGDSSSRVVGYPRMRGEAQFNLQVCNDYCAKKHSLRKVGHQWYPQIISLQHAAIGGLWLKSTQWSQSLLRSQDGFRGGECLGSLKTDKLRLCRIAYSYACARTLSGSHTHD